MKLGIHASVRHGFLHALREAADLGCHTVQIFPYRPGTPLGTISETEARELAAFRAGRRIHSLIVHGVFQPNIASSNEKIQRRSQESLGRELALSQSLDADAFVIHSGSYSPDSNLTDGIKKSGRTIREVLESRPGKTKIVIENVGGGARRIGGKFEELRDLLEEIGMPGRTGICLDTAHAFAAGYPLQSPAGLEDCLARFDKTVGLEKLDMFHINDSLAPLGSHNDIHQHVGEGWIGLDSLRKLCADPRFENRAGILETPKRPAGSDALNLAKLRG